MTQIPTKLEVRNTETGELVETRETHMTLMPAPAGTCPECAVAHDPDMPHNAQSMHYQYWFYGEHGRWPTWADALAHCEPEMKTKWKEALVGMGQWTEGEQDATSNPQAE